LAVEVIRGIKKKLGDDFPISYRMNGAEFLPDGYTVEDEKVIAKILEKEGVWWLSVTGGSHYTSVPQLTPNLPRGIYAYLAREIKSAVNVPVAASNRINHPIIAEEILRKQWADLINVGRGSMADPDWPNKAKAGDFEDIRLCIACNECLDRVVFGEKPARCTVNPKVGQGLEMSLPKAVSVKKVVVVGGGVVGLQAALSCSERGHKVTLFEQEPYLGGKWRAVSAPPGREELFNFLYWLFHQVKRAGVQINTGVKVTPELIRGLKPDSVIVCTGAKPWAPDVPGINLPHVSFAQDVIEGQREVGQKIVVIGGGGVGIETALFLGKRNFSDPATIDVLTEFRAMDRDSAIALLRKKPQQITLVECMSKLGEGLGGATRWILLEEVKNLGIRTMVGALLKEIKKDGVVVTKDGVEEFIEADTVVLATGFVPDPSLYEAIKEVVPETYAVGNTVSTGHAIEGISQALDVALKI
jgi:2,4-dienoyl-CoA reductase (NADPH2)